MTEAWKAAGILARQLLLDLAVSALAATPLWFGIAAFHPVPWTRITGLIMGAALTLRVCRQTRG